MKVGVTYVNVGDRDTKKLFGSIRILRYFAPDLPIRVYSDVDIDVGFTNNIEVVKFSRVHYPTREENRNSSLFRLISLKESDWDVTCYLDNDIFIVNDGFFDGFSIAHNFGITMVENPRYFIKTRLGHLNSMYNLGDLDIGMDVNEYDRRVTQDMPHYMMALNMGVMFYSKKSEGFLDELIEDQRTNPSRGQAGLYRTMWRTKTAPYALPVQWLVCRKHKGIEAPITLHVGHDNIFEWFKQDFQHQFNDGYIKNI